MYTDFVNHGPVESEHLCILKMFYKWQDIFWFINILSVIQSKEKTGRKHQDILTLYFITGQLYYLLCWHLKLLHSLFSEIIMADLPFLCEAICKDHTRCLFCTDQIYQWSFTSNYSSLSKLGVLYTKVSIW